MMFMYIRLIENLARRCQQLSSNVHTHNELTPWCAKIKSAPQTCGSLQTNPRSAHCYGNKLNCGDTAAAL